MTNPSQYPSLDLNFHCYDSSGINEVIPMFGNDPRVIYDSADSQGLLVLTPGTNSWICLVIKYYFCNLVLYGINYFYMGYVKFTRLLASC